MMVVFIILAFIAAIYIYAAVAYYYGFKNLSLRFCGCAGSACIPRKTT